MPSESGGDVFQLLPDDLVLERIILMLAYQEVGKLSATSHRLHEMCERAWEKLVPRDFESVITPARPLGGGAGWKRIYMDMCLSRVEWVGVPKKAVGGSWPCGRWGHSVTVIDGGRLVVFGGESQEETCSDVQVLDCRRWEWSQKQCTGVYPEKRFGHSSAYYKGNVVVFGGSKGTGYFDDLTCLNVERWHWWAPECTGPAPPRRSSHSMTIVGTRAFVFGGIGGFGFAECLNDVAILDLETWAWCLPVVFGAKPPERFVHRMVCVGEELLLFGGRTSQQNMKFNDVHLLNTRTMTWRQPERILGESPSKRGGCSLVAVGHKVLVFCGRAENDKCLYDGVYVLSTFPGTNRPPVWSRPIDQDRHKRLVPGCGPSPRGAHGFALIDGLVLVFGGYGPSLERGEENRERSLDDVFALRLSTLTELQTPEYVSDVDSSDCEAMG